VKGSDVKISARTQLAGTVRRLTAGAVMTEVVVELDGGQEVVAAITAESARQLGIAVGSRVTAIVKSTEVMIGVDDRR
jgi:molybdate transport system regulatory protein